MPDAIADGRATGRRAGGPPGPGRADESRRVRRNAWSPVPLLRLPGDVPGASLSGRTRIRLEAESVTSASSPACLRCGAPMSRKLVRRGPRAGLEMWGCSRWPECDGLINIDPGPPINAADSQVRPTQAIAVGATIAPGGIVETTTPYRFGRVIRATVDEVDVAFDLSVVPEVIETVSLPPVGAWPVDLPVDTRVYVADGSHFLPGRVATVTATPTGPVYGIDVASGPRRSAVAGELRIACGEVIGDPALMLGALQLSPVAEFESRVAAMRLLGEVRSHTSGLGGLLASTLELLPHQVEVVGRVNADPVIRYLLSDEVGLGKTIEAGAIIRDFLTASSDATAVVVAPAHLVDQWQGELSFRFGAEDFAGRLHVEPISWLSHHRNISIPTMLVVDEAHLVVSKAGMERAYPAVVRPSASGPCPAPLDRDARPVR